MQTDWISPDDKKPPQGKKLICFSNGDVTIRQRFNNYWFPIPYLDSKFTDIDEPTLWKDIGMPEDYTGRMYVEVKNVRYSIDELEITHPEVFFDLLKNLLNSYLAGKDYD